VPTTPPKTVRPQLDLARRASSVDEVQGGLTDENALCEVRRCLRVTALLAGRDQQHLGRGVDAPAAPPVVLICNIAVPPRCAPTRPK